MKLYQPFVFLIWLISNYPCSFFYFSVSLIYWEEPFICQGYLPFVVYVSSNFPKPCVFGKGFFFKRSEVLNSYGLFSCTYGLRHDVSCRKVLLILSWVHFHLTFLCIFLTFKFLNHWNCHKSCDVVIVPYLNAKR